MSGYRESDGMLIREQSLAMEDTVLADYATHTRATAGRERPEEECPIRTAYQRDRDRIIHSNAFRRLMHKTQVFLFPQGDHYRTRLTHTLEVGQIARTMARGLRLNEDLTEAIAMGHDLGHTPFGHAGEFALRDCSPFYFVHSEQSVRVVECLERDGAGLNVTREVKNGILCHSDKMPWADTPEGRVVRFADKFAYMNHDTEDAIRAGILDESELPWEVRYRLGQSRNERLTTLISAVIANSTDGDIKLDKDILEGYSQLQQFLFEAVYKNPLAKGEEYKAKDIVCRLYEHYSKNPDRLPEDYKMVQERDGAERAAVDYIASMSDRYCVALYNELYIPKPWGY
ncbi:MAG: deoxyguanosinetriphosphate triphosphohydrolase [Angelakisella sp.]